MMYLASLVEEMRDKVDGYKFVHTKTELDIIVANNTVANKVVIRQDFAHEFFTPTGLMAYIENVRKVNFNIVIELDIQDAIITNDVIIQKMMQCKDISEMVQLMLYHDVEFTDTLNRLINEYMSKKNEMLEFSNQVARLQSIVEQQKAELEEKDYLISNELANKLQYQSKLNALVSRINYQYNKGIDESKLFTVDKNSYDKVLYIKELTRVQYTDSLVYYLQEILKTLYSMPTRVVCIENYYADGKISQYPNLVPHHKLIERDVLSGDILMLGMQPNLMQDILKNSSNISILIILDRGGYSVPHVRGDNVEVLYTVSDLADKPEEIPNGRVISYSESTLFIKYIKDFEKMDMSERLSAYSSMHIVRCIVDLLERRR